MRDIDPIRNPSEALLSAALNRLAKGSARQAPGSVGARLALEFRRRHQRRRRVRAAVVLSFAACLALAITLWLTLPQRAANAPSAVNKPAPATSPDPGHRGAPEESVAARDTRLPGSRRSAPPTISSAGENGFVPLATYDPAMQPSEMQIVRLELSGADLRLVGAPVAEELSDRRLLADIVVGSDGTPYAVRLIR